MKEEPEWCWLQFCGCRSRGGGGGGVVKKVTEVRKRKERDGGSPGPEAIRHGRTGGARQISRTRCRPKVT